MNNLPLVFFGIFFTLAFSWTGIVLFNEVQFGDLEPTSTVMLDPVSGEPISGPYAFIEMDGKMEKVPGLSNSADPQFPRARVGLAQQGKRVYEQMGCLYCHSQQVRRRGFGSDYERGWGNRQTVARDYIHEDRVLLGSMRTGPDLTNVGERLPDANWHYIHLYDPRAFESHKNSTMPPFRFLFEEKPVDPVMGPDPDAIRFPPNVDVPDGYEVVPTDRARALVEYLLSLRLDYELPEAKFAQ